MQSIDPRFALLLLGLVPGLVLSIASPVAAVDGDIVESSLEVTPTTSAFTDRTGESLALIADLGGPGLPALAVGRPGSDVGASDAGSVDLLFLAADGSVVSSRAIEDTPSGDPNSAFALAGGDGFGGSIASLGDLDGDGNLEVAIGAAFTDSVLGQWTGAVWILDLAPGTGIPQSAVRIAHLEGGLAAGTLAVGDQFGTAVAAIGDWDGDGVGDLAVGANRADDGGLDFGAIHILYLNASGTVRAQSKISATSGGLGGTLTSFALFGSAIAAIADQNGDGRGDLAVGVPGANEGSVWLLFMGSGCYATTPVCVVSGQVEIGEGAAGFNANLDGAARFGDGLAWMPAASPLGVDRLAVGSSGQTTGDVNASGSVWLLDLANAAIDATRPIGSQVGWDVTLLASDELGAGLASLGDLDGNGITDLAVGARGSGTGFGRVFTALTTACPSLVLRPVVYHNPNDEPQDPCAPVAMPDQPTLTLNLYIESGGIDSPLAVCEPDQGGGTEICAWDVRLVFENGYSPQSFTPTIAGLEWSTPATSPPSLRMTWVGLGAPQNGPNKIGTLVVANDGSAAGRVRVAPGSAAVGAALQLQTIGERTLAVPEPAGAVGLVMGLGLLGRLAIWRARRRARGRNPGRTCARNPRVGVGVGVAVALGLALGLTVGAAGPSRAALSIKSQLRISEGEAMFPKASSNFTSLGTSLATPGDLDADGTPDLVLGCCRTGGIFPAERFFVEFLDDEGAPAAPPVPSPGFGFDLFAHALTAIPDRDGDGRSDLLVGTPTTGSGSNDQVSMLFLNRDGTRKGTRIQIGDGLGGFPSGLLQSGPTQHYFGWSVAWLGDVDGDPATQEFVAGAPGTVSGGTGSGGVWIVSLDATNTVVDQQLLIDDDFGGPRGANLGIVVGALGDLDGNGTNDLAISAPACNFANASSPGCLLIVLLEPDVASLVRPLATIVVADGRGGLPTPLGSTFRVSSLAWMGDVAGGEGGVLAVGADGSPGGEVWLLHVLSDGRVGGHYRIFRGAGVGETLTTFDAGFGSAVAAPGDLDGDEVADLVVGAESAVGAVGGVGSVGLGAVFIFRMIDSDFDGLDDNLDNCPGGPGIPPEFSFNPDQADADGDGVGDLCDVCPALADPLQGDVDGDGQGDLCEPVVLSLQPTGTPAAPAWDVSIECGAFDVVEANVAVIPPAGGASPVFTSGCPVAPPGGLCASLDLAQSSVSGPGLVSPAGVRSDAFYLHLEGNGAGGQLCQSLDLPAKIGELTTSPIAGTSVAAAALSEEGVETPGFGLPLAADALGAIPTTQIQLVTGAPLPRVTLELGPAVFDGGLTRWDVLLRNGSDRFHRVTFGLVAPFGTSVADMRFVGCDGATAEPGGVRTCGVGVGTTMNASQSWTLGPVASAQTPSGLKEHTLYVVAEGRIPFGLQLPYLNLPSQTIVLGTLELSGTPDLEPALTLEGVDLIADRFGPGTIIPFERSQVGPLANLDEVRLVGQFNPAEDEDGDGVQDLGDNCPFRPNADQVDTGGFQSAEPDAKGNACQCGDGSGDGIVQGAPTPSEDDLTQVRDFLTGRITNPVVAGDIEALCSVVGTPECNIRDLVFLQRALDASTPSATRCDASLAPAPGS